MFILRRPLRSCGIMLPAGSVIDPAGTKHFKARLGERKIINVTEDNYEATKAYLETKYGVVMPATYAECEEANKIAITEETIAEETVAEETVAEETVAEETVAELPVKTKTVVKTKVNQ